jgi:2-oxoglutarate dehydrogenase E2 component (dihydrolipoamide succinyltransferase)
MGESVTEGVIARWLKTEGESVAVDEPVVEIETDKITIEVPAPSAGVLRSHAVAEGATVGVGQTLGEIDEAKPGASNGKPAAAASPATTASATPDRAAAVPSQAGGEPLPAGPSARLEASRQGIDLTQVEGSARGGRITKDDVVRAGQATPTPAAAPEPSKPAAAQSKPVAAPQPVKRVSGEREERKQMSPLRRRVAERLIEAQNTYAILTTFNEVDMSAVMGLRTRYKESFEKRHGVRLGFMSFFVKAAIEALREFPMVNAEIDGDDVVYKYYYDIGVAVGGGKGLVVPIIRDADKLGFAEVEQTIGALGEKARANKLTLEDLTGGTFTISNGGVYGSMLSTPILNPPQTGILGLHNIVERPVAIAGKVEIRPIMYLALSYDHRLLDGREAVQFLVRIKQCIEDPERLLLSV